MALLIGQAGSRAAEGDEGAGKSLLVQALQDPGRGDEKAALGDDWHPVPTSLQTRCSPAGPERQSALNARPLRLLPSTSTLSGPSTAIIWLHPDSRSFAVPACSSARPYMHTYMAPACQHATKPPSTFWVRDLGPLPALNLSLSVSLSLARIFAARIMYSVLCTLSACPVCPCEASNVPSTDNVSLRAKRGLLMRPSVLKRSTSSLSSVLADQQNVDKSEATVLPHHPT